MRDWLGRAGISLELRRGFACGQTVVVEQGARWHAESLARSSSSRPPRGRLTTAFGGALLPVAAVLWRDSERPERRRLRALAAMNALTAALLVGRLAPRRGQTGVAGGMTVAGTATARMALAVAQARVAPRLR